MTRSGYDKQEKCFKTLSEYCERVDVSVYLSCVWLICSMLLVTQHSVTVTMPCFSVWKRWSGICIYACNCMFPRCNDSEILTKPIEHTNATIHWHPQKMFHGGTGGKASFPFFSTTFCWPLLFNILIRFIYWPVFVFFQGNVCPCPTPGHACGRLWLCIVRDPQ